MTTDIHPRVRKRNAVPEPCRPTPHAARKFASMFGLPIATAKAIAELAGYVAEVRHD
jgi:hypothetical protein